MKLDHEWIVCPTCGGEGKCLPDGMRGHAYTQSEIADDPDLVPDMLAGAYDITCPECNGRTTVREITEASISEHDRLERETGECPIYEHYGDCELCDTRAADECAREREAERRMMGWG